ncbi:MAG TPA: GPP34 family phosphoprotein [Acidimicrobiia bacterium]|nr:GPP34 family phosphoprotein [Acidimicrobiia bacterium]
MTDHQLSLPEELLLLGWDDTQGKNRHTQNLPMLLGGAAILELVLEDRVTVTDGRLEAVGHPTGHPALDLVLDRIRTSRRPRSAKAWVQYLGNRRELKAGVLRRLVERGILREGSGRIFGFSVTRFPVNDVNLVDGIRQRVTRALTQPEPVGDPRDAMLASLVQPGGGGLLRRLVPREQRGEARKRAKALSKGEAVSAEVAKAISDANAAIAAVIAATTVATSSSD